MTVFEVNSGLPVSSFPGSSWWGREKKPWAGEGQEKGPVGRGIPHGVTRAPVGNRMDTLGANGGDWIVPLEDAGI